MPRFTAPSWLRRSLEAAFVAAIVAIASLIGTGLSAGAEPYALPPGGAGALLLAPAVLALGVIPAAYPIAMAATRDDAIFGAIAAYLVAADLTVVFAGGRIILERSQAAISGGLLAAGLALLAAIAGLIASQVATPLGFGRRAGAISTVSAALASVVAITAFALLA
jgi:hypothetical protein